MTTICQTLFVYNSSSSKKLTSGQSIRNENPLWKAREDRRICMGLTGDVVAQYSRRDNSAIRAEEILQILLRHILRQTANVQIRTFDRLAARSRVRYLKIKQMCPEI